MESKIFVVVLILAIIYVGIAIFLFYLEHRLRKAEKWLKEIETEMKQ